MATDKTPLLQSAAPVLTTEALGKKQEIKPGHTMSYQGILVSMSYDQRTNISSDDSEPQVENTSYTSYFSSAYSYSVHYGMRGLSLFTPCMPYFASAFNFRGEEAQHEALDNCQPTEGASLLRNPSNNADLHELALKQWDECHSLKMKYRTMFQKSNPGWTTDDEMVVINRHNDLSMDCYLLFKRAEMAGRKEAGEFLRANYKYGPETNLMSPKPPIFGF